jgi:cobalamin 5'-phosphate synthase/cobalamin synthase
MRSARGRRWLSFADFLTAVRFLTAFPVPQRLSGEFSAASFGRSVNYYGLVGFLIGAVVCAAMGLFSFILPVPAAAVFVLIVWVAASGGLHLDGLMDTADGIFSRRPREEILKIMKDSHVGAMGVIAGMLHLLAKLGLIGAVMSSALSVIPVLWIPAFSRWFVVWAIAFWPYAGRPDGYGALLRHVTPVSAAVSTLLLCLISFICAALFSFPWTLVCMLLLFAAVTLAGGTLFCRYFRNKLGGLTGDVYGALIEMLELALLFAFVAAGRLSG